MNMEKSFHFKIVLLGAFIILLTLQMCETKHIRKSTKKVKKEEIPVQLSVDGNKFTSVGCFRDAWNRVIPALEGEHQLLMEPNYKARKFALLKCARAAMDKHLKVFGIENGGQCFGAEDERSLNKYGTAVECRRDGKGGPWSLQAYKFTTLPINGGFSPWSRWTTCSKTCDHGVRRRMRTCSNPPPSNGGKDCSGLGPSVEGEICKDKECPTVLIDEAESGNTARPSRLSTTPSAPTAEQSGQSDKPKPSTSENKPPVIKEGSLIVLPKAAENRQGSDSQPDTQASKEDPHKDSSSVPNEKPREPSVDTPKMQSEAMPIPKEGSDNGQRIEKGKATDSKMQEGDSAKPSSAQSDSVGFGPQEASHHVHPAGSEPFQFIDEPEDQRNPYVVPSMHQSESLKSHEQLSLPENPQDIDPSVAQETYNGEPAVSGNAVQPNTPMGPMAEMNHMNRNFNPSEPQQTEQSPSHSEECFCPKKVCDAKADIAFLVDGSSDIPQVYFTHVLDFMKALTRGFSSKDTQVNLVAYGDDAASAFNNFSPVQNLHEIDDSIDSMTYMGGDPRTGNALTKVQNGLFKTFGRTDAKHALILLTSGSSSDDTIQAAEDLRKSGIKLTTIGLGKLANVKELIDISSEPKSSHVFTAFLDTLPDIMDDIVKGVCSDIDGKLYNKDKQCICGANKVKNSKDKSTDVLSELGKSKEGKEEPPNGPREGSDDKTLQNKTRTDAKSSNNGDENAVPSGDGGKDNGGHKVDHKGENNGEAIGSTTHVSPQSSEPNRETVKIDSKDERKENSSTVVENKEQNKQTGQSLQERPSQPNREGSGSSPKENPKTDMSERIKTDEKVDLPEPQGTRNEKAVPKKDSNADNSININNQGPSGEQNGPIEIPAALEQIKTSNENMKTQSEPPETDSGTPQITILDNGYSKLMKSREQSSRGRQNNPGNSNPQGGVARPSEDNRPTQEPTPNRIENKESKPQEKVMEATESSFPPKAKPSEKQQQQESQGKPSEDSKDKTTSSQVEIPNPTSKTPPKQEEKSRANEQEQKGKDSEQHPPQMTRHPDGTFMAGQAEGSRISGIKETIVSKGCSVNLGVVLDSKTTAYGEDDNAKKLLFFAKKLTHMFPVSPEGNRVGMMVYSGSPKLKVVHFDHSLDPNTMDKAIDSASYLNMEIKTGKVLNFAQEHLFSRIPSGKQNVLLLITDGVSYDDVTSPANELKRRGVEIFVVGVGEGVIGKELEAIASEPASDHVVKTSYDFKQSLLEDIKQRICSSASKKGDDAYLPRRRGRLYRVLTEIERRRK